MRLTLTLAALTALSLAACEDQTAISPSTPPPSSSQDSSAPVDASEPPARIGGVDVTGAISVLGTEPFWGVTLEGEAMTYSGVDRPEQRAERPIPIIDGRQVSWTTTTDAGNPLVVTLTAGECSDGMSDRTYPLTARVEIAGEALNGCAASTDWIHSVGEDGQPREG